MLKKSVALALLLAAPLFAEDALWKMKDPRGDDHGNGKLAYPMNDHFQRGDLDLVSLSATRVEGGTQFEAEFARPVRQPQRVTVDAIGTQLNQMARLGFYNFNLDIYVDTDGVPGSGSISTLPGRGVTIDPATAWEKVISLTPDPQAASAEMKRVVIRNERRREEASGNRGVITDERKGELRGNVDEFVFFPSAVRVTGNRIAFFVPEAFLPSANGGFHYVVAVTGADLMQRIQLTDRLLGRDDSGEALMVLPVRPGRPTDAFGGAIERDDFMPPIVDVIVGEGEEQKKVLSNYDSNVGRPAVLKGVKP